MTLWGSAADGAPLQRALERGVGKGGTGEVDGPIAVIVGNEGAGIRPQLNAIAAQRVAIPLAQGDESLHVSVAAAIQLYEVTHRQRSDPACRRQTPTHQYRLLPRQLHASPFPE